MPGEGVRLAARWPVQQDVAVPHDRHQRIAHQTDHPNHDKGQGTAGAGGGHLRGGLLQQGEHVGGKDRDRDAGSQDQQHGGHQNAQRGRCLEQQHPQGMGQNGKCGVHSGPFGVAAPYCAACFCSFAGKEARSALLGSLWGGTGV